MADSCQLACCQPHMGRQPTNCSLELPGISLLEILKLGLQIRCIWI